MDAREDDPTASRGPLGDGGRPVGVTRDHRAPARELWAVLPVLVEGGRSRTPNREGRSPDPSVLVGAEVEVDAGGEVEAVVGAGVPSKERPAQTPK